MTSRSLLVVVALVAMMNACNCGDPEDPAERGALIALEIQEEPANAEAILEDHELTIEEFEALMYEIAADPELSERYEALLTGEDEDAEDEEDEEE